MPPTIVMEIAPGNSLQELFGMIKEFTWNSKINIVCKIGNIVDNCHKLPEMVLHRDIKPSNIMIEGLDYTDYSFSNLYVLDFDMSWHKNSSEKDIIFESRDDFGYLAPEQTDPSRRTSTRSAKVDSYGLAMTTFALFGGLHPVPGWTMSGDWQNRVYQVMRSGYSGLWNCLPRRVSRAVIDASVVEQDARLDFSSFWRRLAKVKAAADAPNSTHPLDLIAEEILSRVSGGRDYKWDDIADRGSIEFFNGTKFELYVDDSQTSIYIYVGFSDIGSSQFKSRNQIIGEARDLLEILSKKYSTKPKRVNLGHGVLDYSISIPVTATLSFAQSVVENLNPSIDKLLKIQ